MPNAHPLYVRIATVTAFFWALGVNAARPIAIDTFFWRDGRKRSKELAPDHVSDGYIPEFMHIWVHHN